MSMIIFCAVALLGNFVSLEPLPSASESSRQLSRPLAADQRPGCLICLSIYLERSQAILIKYNLQRISGGLSANETATICSETTTELILEDLFSFNDELASCDQTDGLIGQFQLTITALLAFHCSRNGELSPNTTTEQTTPSVRDRAIPHTPSSMATTERRSAINFSTYCREGYLVLTPVGDCTSFDQTVGLMPPANPQPRISCRNNLIFDVRYCTCNWRNTPGFVCPSLQG